MNQFAAQQYQNNSWLFEKLLGPLGSYGVYSGLSYANASNPPQPDSEGWYNLFYKYPSDHILLQFERRVYPSSHFLAAETRKHSRWIGYYNDLPEDFNVADLYWRYTGIGRHQLEAANAC